MKLPNKTFCILPWVSLEASPIGTVRPCCLTKEEITDESGNQYQLANTSFDTIRNSSYMQRLRTEFIAGKLPSTCERCWAIEQAGGISKRQHSIDRLKHIVSHDTWTEDSKELLFFDLKLGNICNLKCRICGPWSSSTYAAEQAAELNHQDRKQSYAYQMLAQGRWPRESQNFWNELNSISNQIRYLEFTGGEPFMIAEHFDFLQTLIDSGLANNIELHYNTNGTIYPEHAEKIWQYFKLVEIAVSIDDIEERFEYQRSGAVWSEVVSNIDKFFALRSEAQNIQLQLCCTVSVWNVLYLKNVADFADERAWDYVYWNILHDAPEWCIANLDKETKMRIIWHLTPQGKFAVSNQHIDDFERIVAFMNSRINLEGNSNTLRRIAQLDQRRKTSLSKTMPLLATILKYHG